MTARDERIHALRAQGLTVRQIAAEVGLSHARVVQVLGRERRTLDELEAGLRGELADLIAERERITTSGSRRGSPLSAGPWRGSSPSARSPRSTGCSGWPEKSRQIRPGTP